MKTQPPKVSLRLRHGEAPGRGLRRLARGQIDAACRVLEKDGDPHQAVHEARKALKKIRAILRFAAPEWSRKRLETEIEPFRKAAQLLAPLRDAQVRIQTFDTLLREAELPPEEFAGLRAALESSGQRLMRQAGRRRRQAVELLRAARSRIGRWQLGGVDKKSMEREIQHAYSKALACYRQTPGPAPLHAWRKRMKTLLYHLRIWRDFLSARAAKKAIATLDEMGELAGNIHDLTVLRQTLADAKTNATSALLLGEIESISPASTRTLLALGAAFFRKSPCAFARWLGLGSR